MEPMGSASLHPWWAKDDICVAKYDFDGLGPQIVEPFVHFMVGWVGLTGQETN